MQLQLRRLAGALVDARQGIGQLESATVGDDDVGETFQPPAKHRMGRHIGKLAQASLEHLLQHGQQLSGHVSERTRRGVWATEPSVGELRVQKPTLRVGRAGEGRQHQRADHQPRVVNALPLHDAQILSESGDAIWVEKADHRRSDVGREQIAQWVGGALRSQRAAERGKDSEGDLVHAAAVHHLSKSWQIFGGSGSYVPLRGSST